MKTPAKTSPPPLERELWEQILEAIIGYFWRLFRHQPVKFALWALWGVGAYLVLSRLWLTYLPPLAPQAYVPPQVEQARTQMTWNLVIGSTGGVLLSVCVLGFLCAVVQRGPLAWTWGDLVPISRWAAERKKRKHPPPPPYGPGDLVLGVPYTPRDDDHWQDGGQWSEQLQTDATFNLTKNEAKLNTLVVAPQNTGKTTLMRDYLSWCIRNGYNVIVADPKGDDYAEHATYATHRLRLDNPERSHKLCVWDPSAKSPRKKAEILAEAIIPDPGGEVNAEAHYFAANARTALGNLCEAWVAAYTITTPNRTVAGRMPTLAELRDLLLRQEARDRLRERLPGDSPQIIDLEEVDKLSRPSTNSDPIGNLRLALNVLVKETEGLLVGEEEGGYSITELMRGAGTFLWLSVPISNHPEAAKVLVRLVVQLYTSAITGPTMNDRLKLLLLDEAHQFLTQSIATGMAMGRSRWGGFVLAFQSLAQIKDPALRYNILSTAGNKIVMGALEIEDAEYFSRTFGTHRRPLRSQTTSVSTGQNIGRNMGSSYGGGGGVFAASGMATGNNSSGRSTGKSRSDSFGETVQLQSIADWEPSELRSLPSAHAVIEWRDGSVNPPRPPQTRKVYLHRPVIDRALGDWEWNARYPTDLYSIQWTRLLAWREARVELTRWGERWQGRKAIPPQTPAERLLIEAAEQWVRYWDAQLLAAETDDSTIRTAAEPLRQQAQDLEVRAEQLREEPAAREDAEPPVAVPSTPPGAMNESPVLKRYPRRRSAAPEPTDPPIKPLDTNGTQPPAGPDVTESDEADNQEPIDRSGLQPPTEAPSE